MEFRAYMNFMKKLDIYCTASKAVCVHEISGIHSVSTKLMVLKICRGYYAASVLLLFYIDLSNIWPKTLLFFVFNFWPWTNSAKVVLKLGLTFLTKLNKLSMKWQELTRVSVNWQEFWRFKKKYELKRFFKSIENSFKKLTRGHGSEFISVMLNKYFPRRC